MSIIDRSKELLSSAKNKVGDAVNNDSIKKIKEHCVLRRPAAADADLNGRDAAWRPA